MLSIIAVVIDNLEVNKRFVSSIRQYTKNPYELVLIDNESRDQDTIEFLRDSTDIYYRFDKRTDLSKAWNKGIELSRGEYLAVVNNDTVVTPDWFQPLKDTLDTNEKAGVVSPITRWIIIEMFFGYKTLDNFDTTFSTPFKLIPFKEVLWGEFCVFKRKAFEDVGGYCELYKDYCGEDLEICFQLFSKGYDIYIDPRVFIHHEGGASRNMVLKEESDRINERNFNLFKSRWPEYTRDWD